MEDTDPHLAPYLALLCVITLVALGALPAVGELIIEQPFPIHLQQEEGVSSSPALQQSPPLPSMCPAHLQTARVDDLVADTALHELLLKVL